MKTLAEADVLLEVMGRSVRQTEGIKSFIVPIGFAFFSASYPTAQTVVFVRMTGGACGKDLGGALGQTWSEAAIDAADQIARWIDTNHDQIVAKRAAHYHSTSHPVAHRFRGRYLSPRGIHWPSAPRSPIGP